MGLILFQSAEAEATLREYVRGSLEVWQGFLTEIVHGNPKAIDTLREYVVGEPTFYTSYITKGLPVAQSTEDKWVSGTSKLNFLCHTHFSGMDLYEAEMYQGFQWQFKKDMNYGEDKLPLDKVKDSRGMTGASHSGPVTGNSLHATTPDCSKVIIIDPVQGLVRVLSSTGDILFRKIISVGEFYDVITITASNTHYFLLKWESASFNGGNKFSFQKRLISDSSIVYSRLYETLHGEPVAVSSAYMKGDPVAQTLNDVFVIGLPSVSIQYPPASYVIGKLQAVTDDFIKGEPVAKEIRIELRKVGYKSADVSLQADDRNMFPEFYNIETDVNILTKHLWPIRVSDAEHELPFHETIPYYYGHPLHKLKSEIEGFTLDDTFYVPIQHIAFDAIDHIPRNAERIINTRQVTAPHLVATETKLYFGTVKYRGAWPSENPTKEENTIDRRSSRTLFVELSTESFTPVSDTVCVFASGAAGVKANDNIGIVMLDFYHKTNSAGIMRNMLEGYNGSFETISTYPEFKYDYFHKYATFFVLNLDLSFKSSKPMIPPNYKLTWNEHYFSRPFSYIQLTSNPFPGLFTFSSVNDGGDDDKYRSVTQPWSYLDTVNIREMSISSDYKARVNGLSHLRAGENEYNGLFHLVGDRIVWFSDFMTSIQVDAPYHHPSESSSKFPFTRYSFDSYNYAEGVRLGLFPAYKTPVKPHHRISVLDSSLNKESEFYIDSGYQSFLCVSLNESKFIVKGSPEAEHEDSYRFVIGDLNVTDFMRSEVIIGLPVATVSNLVKGCPVADSSAFVKGAPVASSLGYTVSISIITNTSLIESLDFNERPDYYMSHPTGQSGTYPYGVRFWELGIGYPDGTGMSYPLKTGGTYITPDDNYKKFFGDKLYCTPEQCWLPKLPYILPSLRFNRSDGQHDATFRPYESDMIPHPVQYIADNVNDALFGLFRHPEGRSWMSGKWTQDGPNGSPSILLQGADLGFVGTTFGTRHPNNIGNVLSEDFVESLGSSLQRNKGACVNFPIGGVLHKYSKPNSPPIKSVIIPGYVEVNTSAEYDKVITCRYFGNSQTRERLYVIRALGRPDYFHTSVQAYFQNASSPWVRRPDASYGYTAFLMKYPPVEPTSLHPHIEPASYRYLTGGIYDALNPYISEFGDRLNYIQNTGYPNEYEELPLPVLRGWVPSDSGVMPLNTADYSPKNHYQYMMTMTNFFSDESYSWDGLSGGDNILYHVANHDNMVRYEQKRNTYEVRDILEYDYDLTFLRRISIPSIIPENETLLHVTERGGVFYFLTQKKAEIKNNWAQFHAKRGIGTPISHGYEDDKYGFMYESIKIYTAASVASSSGRLLYEIPWAGHSVGDILIQEVTDTHVWVNWSGVHKSRAGSCLGMAVRLDGTGFTEIPSAIAIVKDHYQRGKWSVIAYTNTASGAFVSSFEHVTRRIKGEKFNRYGDGRVTSITVLDERTLTPIKSETAYQPFEETAWFTEYRRDVMFSWSPDTLYPSAPQPGYGQYVRKVEYHWVSGNPVAVESVGSAKPRTRIGVTSGGPSVFPL
jgi:hypothetical protein